jgi:hypothetical protein
MMSTPNPQITTINPSKSKTWVAAIGGALTVVVPLILSSATYLPDPWPALIGGLVALLTMLGVYKAPYKPEGTSVVSTRELSEIASPTLPVDPPSGGYRNPYRQ